MLWIYKKEYVSAIQSQHRVGKVYFLYTYPNYGQEAEGIGIGIVIESTIGVSGKKSIHENQQKAATLYTCCLNTERARICRQCWQTHRLWGRAKQQQQQRRNHIRLRRRRRKRIPMDRVDHDRIAPPAWTGKDLLTLRDPSQNPQKLEISVCGTKKRAHGQNKGGRLLSGLDDATSGDKTRARRGQHRAGRWEQTNPSSILPLSRGFSKENRHSESDRRDSEGSDSTAAVAVAIGRKNRRTIVTWLSRMLNSIHKDKGILLSTIDSEWQSLWIFFLLDMIGIRERKTSPRFETNRFWF